VPTSAAAIAASIGHVRPSRRDTCETQIQIAAQSSRIATIQSGQETVYKADCAALPKDGRPAGPQSRPHAEKRTSVLSGRLPAGVERRERT
jgi:hypothetical protein